MPLHKDVVNNRFRVNSGTEHSVSLHYRVGRAVARRRTSTLDPTAIEGNAEGK